MNFLTGPITALGDFVISWLEFIGGLGYLFRELGPLVAAIVLTGFAGASIAAELGTMVVSEEIEALEASAIPPIRFLVVPRVLATTIMMICLAVLGDLMGMMGGLVVSHTVLV